jgi:hypothetical protein
MKFSIHRGVEFRIESLSRTRALEAEYQELHPRTEHQALPVYFRPTTDTVYVPFPVLKLLRFVINDWESYYHEPCAAGFLMRGTNVPHAFIRPVGSNGLYQDEHKLTRFRPFEMMEKIEYMLVSISSEDIESLFGFSDYHRRRPWPAPARYGYSDYYRQGLAPERTTYYGNENSRALRIKMSFAQEIPRNRLANDYCHKPYRYCPRHIKSRIEHRIQSLYAFITAPNENQPLRLVDQYEPRKLIFHWEDTVMADKLDQLHLVEYEGERYRVPRSYPGT